MTIQTIGIIICFLVFVVLMMKRICPMSIAFPLMALAIAIIVGIPAFNAERGFFSTLMEAGAIRNKSHIAVLISSAWLGGMMMVTGISKRIIKLAAELGGDRPFLVTMFVIIAVAACMTTISGLGAVVMLGTIAVPIMINVGVPGLVAACAFLFAYAIGLTVNMGNWAYFASITTAGFDDVKGFAITLMAITAAVTVFAMIVMFRKNGVKFSWAARTGEIEDDCEFDDSKVPVAALFTPLIPLVLVLFTKVGTNASFFIAMIYCIVTCCIFSPQQYKLGDMFNRVLMKAASVGITGAAMVIVQSVLCGVLVEVLSTEEVTAALTGVVSNIFPKTQMSFILFFAILAPLALFRGPTNIWGVGASIATLLVSIGILPANAVMAAYISCERTQVISDPTNTHNIWLAGYVGSDTITLLKKVLPWSWIMSALGIIVAGFMFF